MLLSCHFCAAFLSLLCCFPITSVLLSYHFCAAFLSLLCCFPITSVLLSYHFCAAFLSLLCCFPITSVLLSYHFCAAFLSLLCCFPVTSVLLSYHFCAALYTSQKFEDCLTYIFPPLLATRHFNLYTLVKKSLAASNLNLAKSGALYLVMAFVINHISQYALAMRLCKFTIFQYFSPLSESITTIQSSLCLSRETNNLSKYILNYLNTKCIYTCMLTK